MIGKKPAQPFEGEDLSARARRGALSADEHSTFERALEASATLQVAHRVGRDFDEACRIRSGDDELIQRVSARVLEPQPKRAVCRGVRAMPAAAVLFGASAAAAASAWLVLPRSNEVRVLSAPVPSGVASPRTRNTQAAHAVGKPAQQQPIAASESAARSAPSTLSSAASSAPPTDAVHSGPASIAALANAVHSGAASSRSPATAVRSAETLFRDAKAARRVGDIALARALYGELQTSFPETREARVSRVSLGKLCLGAGLNREAERQFRQYLATGGGDLAEEAEVGRADALARLGEIDEERRVWQDLQRTHPAGVYAERARRRLRELSATGPGFGH